MTKRDELCAWCGGSITTTPGPGRPRRYCRPSHRQRAYEARRAAATRSLAPDEVVITARGWQAMRDALEQLGEVSRDLAADLAAGRRPSDDYVAGIAALTAAVAELQTAVEPRAAW